MPTITTGRLCIGIDAAPPVPLQIGSPDTDDFRGYEVDLLRELSERRRLAIDYRRADWSVIINDLVAGRIDAVCSAATMTPERARLVDFCLPHLTIQLAVVTRAHDVSGPRLHGRRVGVRIGTTAESYARSHGASAPALRSESNEELYAALADGTIDTVVDDSPIAAHFARAVPGLRVAGSLPNTDACYAIMVRKGNGDLRTTLDAELRAMTDEGVLAALRDKWGLSSAMRLPMC